MKLKSITEKKWSEWRPQATCDMSSLLLRFSSIISVINLWMRERAICRERWKVKLPRKPPCARTAHNRVPTCHTSENAAKQKTQKNRSAAQLHKCVKLSRKRKKTAIGQHREHGGEPSALVMCEKLRIFTYWQGLSILSITYQSYWQGLFHLISH